MEMYGHLLDRFGPQHWWPADTPFEVAVGAILTQNTSWKNVERAVENLKRMDVLTVTGIDSLSEQELALLIRPSGCFTVKARRLKSYIGHITGKYGGDFYATMDGELADRRSELLSISGIGPETADSMLLYAGGRPTFVVDAYTRRVMARHGLVSEGAGYDDVRSLFMDNLPADAALFNEYHALFVAVGKNYCRPRQPRCEGCPLTEDRMT